jgi:hypothetical protein
MRQEIIENGIFIYTQPFSGNNEEAKVGAEVTVSPVTGNRGVRLFIRGLDYRGMTVAESVNLASALHSVRSEAEAVVKGGKAVRAKKRVAKERSAKRRLARTAAAKKSRTKPAPKRRKK